MGNAVQTQRPIASLFEPASVAVIGASTDPAKWGNLTASKLLRGEARRRVYLVNRAGAEILGRRSYTSVAELPEAPELAVVTVPKAGFADAVDEALAAGAKAIVGMTAGFGETGAGGARMQEEIVARVRAAGSVLVGPNCMGVFDAAAELHCLPWAEPPVGTIGVLSASGSMIMDIANRAAAHGLGISRAASVGNQADLTIADLIDSFAAHEATDVIAIYCEDMGDGRALFEAAERAIAAGRPVVVLAPGEAPAASRAARSHTGALLSDRRVIEAACRASGAVLAGSIRDLTELVQALRAPVQGHGRRVAVASDAGGLTVLGADAVAAAGLELPVFSPQLEARLSELSLPGAGVSNPIDIVGLVTVDEFVPVLELVLESGEVDAVLANISIFNSESRERERELGLHLARLALRSGIPMAVATPDGASPGVEALRGEGIPVYPDVEVAARALSVLCDPERGSGVPVFEADRVPPADADTYFGARRLLAGPRLPFAAAEQVTDLPEAIAAATRIGYPVVLKAVDLLHKSDAGGVALDLDSPAALEAAFVAMSERLGGGTFSVERMERRPEATELIVGGRNEERFGPVVMVGLGGIFSEVLDDTAVALAPIDPEEAVVLLKRLRGAPLLLGARGRAEADLAAVGEAVAAVSEAIAAHPSIAELDVNPLLASAEGALALDARILLRGD